MVMTWNVASAKAKLSEVLKRAQRSPQRVVSRGKPVAVIVSAADFDRMQQTEAPKEAWVDRLLRETAELRTGNGVPLPKRRRPRALPRFGPK